MDMLNKDILVICKEFIELVEKLHKSGLITYEQYIEMTKLKFEYINIME